MAVQDPDLRITQPVVPGNFQKIITLLDAVVLLAPYNGEGLGVAAFGRVGESDVVGAGGGEEGSAKIKIIKINLVRPIFSPNSRLEASLHDNLS